MSVFTFFIILNYWGKTSEEVNILLTVQIILCRKKETRVVFKIVNFILNTGNVIKDMYLLEVSICTGLS